MNENKHPKMRWGWGGEKNPRRGKGALLPSCCSPRIAASPGLGRTASSLSGALIPIQPILCPVPASSVSGVGGAPKPQQQTCEALLGKSLIWYHGQQVPWCGFDSASPPRPEVWVTVRSPHPKTLRGVWKGHGGASGGREGDLAPDHSTKAKPDSLGLRGRIGPRSKTATVLRVRRHAQPRPTLGAQGRRRLRGPGTGPRWCQGGEQSRPSPPTPLCAFLIVSEPGSRARSGDPWVPPLPKATCSRILSQPPGGPGGRPHVGPGTCIYWGSGLPF